jgi:hypothetical protein
MKNKVIEKPRREIEEKGKSLGVSLAQGFDFLNSQYTKERKSHYWLNIYCCLVQALSGGEHYLKLPGKGKVVIEYPKVAL